MTAKISDCKKGSRRKIKQVISVESEREGGSWEAAMRSEAAAFLSSCKRLCFQSHMCRAYKGRSARTALCGSYALWEVMTVCKLRSSGSCVCASSCHTLVYQADAAISLLHQLLLWFISLFTFCSSSCLSFPPLPSRLSLALVFILKTFCLRSFSWESL